MKKTMKNAKLGDAMKKAAAAWKNRDTASAKKMGKRKTVRKSARKTMRKRRGGDAVTPAESPAADLLEKPEM
jgi:TnpA family transposase